MLCYAGMPALTKKKILITGGSGLIGSALTSYLEHLGHDISILSRQPQLINKHRSFFWDPSNQNIDKNALVDQDIIINLAGTSIAEKFWTKKRKTEIIDSRVEPLQLLKKTLADNQLSPEKILSVSAIGYYGDRPNIELSEKSAPGDGFLANVCQLWESEATTIYKGVIILRLGIVLSEDGGYLMKMRRLMKRRLNVIFGNGKQLISWIHMDDVINAITHIIQQDKNKPIYNLTAPHPLAASELQAQIAKRIDLKPLTIKIPGWLIKKLIGDFSELFLQDQNVIPENLHKDGFVFTHPTFKM